MPPRLAAAFALLLVPVQDRVQAARVASQEDADQLRDTMVTEALGNFRRLIKTAHPDHGGSQEQAQQLLDAKAIVTKCQFQYAMAAPRPQVTILWWSGNWSGTATGTTSTSWTRTV